MHAWTLTCPPVWLLSAPGCSASILTASLPQPCPRPAVSSGLAGPPVQGVFSREVWWDGQVAWLRGWPPNGQGLSGILSSKALLLSLAGGK